MQYDFNDYVLTQAAVGLNSRSEVNLEYNPIISAPMDTVISKENADLFRDQGINICYPRGLNLEPNEVDFVSVGLNEFKELLDGEINLNYKKICVDVANGNMPILHTYIKTAKEKWPNIIIMSGNVASPEAFYALAKSGCDYIRVGVGGGCLEASTRILMANGTYTNICDVEVGDFIINKNGDAVKVINKFYSGLKNVKEIKHNAFHKPLIITSDHNVLVSDLSKFSKNTISSRGYKKCFKSENVMWKPILNSTKDNLLAPTNIKYKLDDKLKINVSKFNSKFSLAQIESIDSCYELGYIFGLFLGDGSSRTRETFVKTRKKISKTGDIEWCFNKNENEIANKLANYIKICFKQDVKIVEYTSKIKVILYSKWCANFFNEFYFNKVKKLPSKYYCLDKKYLEGLFDGLIDSDGSTSNKRVDFYNTSEHLIEIIYFIQSVLNGYFPNSETRKRTCGKLVNCNENNLKPNYATRMLSNYKVRQISGFNLLKITKTSEILEQVDTYDLEVECETHSFIANNCIVHNSGCLTSVHTGVGQGMATTIILCKRMLDLHENLNCKIVADGGFKNYRDIILALALGADYVMLGGILNKCLESCAEKTIQWGDNKISTLENFEKDVTNYENQINLSYNPIRIAPDFLIQRDLNYYIKKKSIQTSYRGMSTKAVQKDWGREVLKSSEGLEKQNLVEYTISGWMENFIDYLKSAMSYSGTKKLSEFKKFANCELISPAVYNRFNK